MGENNCLNKSSTADDALRVLVRMLARQAARDRLAESSRPADRPHCEEVIHDKA